AAARRGLVDGDGGGLGLGAAAGQGERGECEGEQGDTHGEQRDKRGRSGLDQERAALHLQPADELELAALVRGELDGDGFVQREVGGGYAEGGHGDLRRTLGLDRARE